MDDDADRFELLQTELKEIPCPSLNVHVDFNDLYSDKGDDAFEIIAKLRDILS